MAESESIVFVVDGMSLRQRRHYVTFYMSHEQPFVAQYGKISRDWLLIEFLPNLSHS